MAAINLNIHLEYDEVVERLKAEGWVIPVLCKDYKHCFVDGDNVRFNVCELNHNRVQADDWFCADGERKGGEGTSDGETDNKRH